MRVRGLAAAMPSVTPLLANGVHLGWVTADEWYAEKPSFIGVRSANLSITHI